MADLTYWEVCALEQIAAHGARYAGSGSGAISDACWALERRGLLDRADVAGAPYLVLSLDGWRAINQAEDQRSNLPENA